MKKLTVLMASFLFSISAYCDESLNTRIHNFYQSPRAMGMGNAFSAISDDYAALFYNPSMLSFRKNSEFQINLISAAVASKTPSLSKEIKDANDSAQTDNDKANAVSAVLEKYYGKPLGARISPLEFIWVSPNWGMALVMGDVTVDALIQRQLGPVIDLYAIKDTSLSYAYSTLISSEISVGGTARFQHRSELQGVYSALDLAIDSNLVDFKKSAEGTTFDFDLAFTFKPDFNSLAKPNDQVVKNHKAGKARVTRMFAQEKAAEKAAEKSETQVETKTAFTPEKPPEVVTKVPQDVDTKTDGIQINTKKLEAERALASHQPLAFTAVLRNALALEYSKTALINKDSTVAPRRNERTIDLGVSYAVFDNSFSNLKVAAEAKNLLHRSETLNKGLHLGLEYTLVPLDWFVTQYRVGLNQMYFTAGFGLQLSFFNLEFVTYGEEFGTADKKVENRVNAITVAFKF
ncbi:MAG: hypothetical protein H7Z71_10765 [Moraxellaceae bacterium]|nr:hypothetical protein [Pseudobdellovibrionaceae bacterium]